MYPEVYVTSFTVDTVKEEERKINFYLINIKQNCIIKMIIIFIHISMQEKKIEKQKKKKF